MKKKGVLSTCMLALIIGVMPSTAYADIPTTVIPSAGSLLSELEPERHIMPRPAKPQIDINMQTPASSVQTGRIIAKKIHFVCQETDVQKELDFLTTDKLNKKLSFDDMQELALAATNHLRDQGYMTAIVYIPEQKFDDSATLRFNVILGRFGDILLTNKSELTDQRVLGYTYEIRPGQIITSKTLDKTLLVLNDIPGIIARASLEPGKLPGTANIHLDVTTLEKEGGYISSDNYGSTSTGKWRFGGNYHYNNISHVGDQLQLNYLTSTHDMDNYSVQYSLPLGRDGANSHIAYSRMNYGLGDKFTYMNADGYADTFELGFTVPMYRSLMQSSFYDVVYRNRQLTDKMFNGVWNSGKSSDAIDLGFHGYLRGENSSFTYGLTHTIGKMYMDSDIAQATDLLDTAGWFNKTYLSTSFIRRLDERWNATLAVSGQYAYNNLDSSEDFYGTGPNGVRAFSQGELSGDSGLLGTLEFTYTTGQPKLQLAAFIDAARIRYSKDPLPNSGDNYRDLAGAGLSIIWNESRDLYARLDWATPIGDHWSETDNERTNNTWWFRIVKQL